MNKKIIVFFTLLFICGATFASGKEDQGPDQSIIKLVEKLERYPDNKKAQQELQTMFNQANQADLNRIKELRNSGQPDIWYEIFKRYDLLEMRQQKVFELPSSTLNSIGFRKEDYTNAKSEAINHAAAYLYAHAAKLLSGKTTVEARQAYDELFKLAGIASKYRDLDSLIRKAVLNGAENIVFELYNKTGEKLNTKIIEDLSKLVWEYKQKNFGQKKSDEERGPYIFKIQVVLTDLSVTPDQMKTVQYREERDVYNEGVVVDTIGVDVTEYHQRKVAEISGFIKYVDEFNNQVINTVPISVKSYFTNVYASIQGNPEACGDDTRKLLLNKQMTYPPNGAIVMDAVDKFTKSAGAIIFGRNQEK